MGILFCIDQQDCLLFVMGTCKIYQLICLLLPWLLVALISWVVIIGPDTWDTFVYLLSMDLNLGLSQHCPRFALLRACMITYTHSTT